MKKIFAGMLVLFLAAAVFAVNPGVPALIPQPQQLETQNGQFQITPDTKIFAGPGSLPTARQLAAWLRPATGYSFAAGEALSADREMTNSILLTTENADASLGTEGYELIVLTNRMVLRAPTSTGLFYGMQTLLQLLPPEIFSTNIIPLESWPIPCVRIKDWPRFQWRGLMLDVSRHFYNKDEVEKILDLMALHKLNIFHWHLVDDQGWRLEIKKYPQLTQIGAWRKQSAFGKAGTETNAHPIWAQPSVDKFDADGRYGGFYTQADVREIVAYATARHITIVPEIEMPGHSAAALLACPQFGGANSSDTNRLIGRGIYNPAKEETFQFLEDVLTEVFQLFPGKYVHIGGDEVKKDFWKNSPECQALMQREGLKNEEELQSWFIRRIEKFVNAHGKTLIGWSEILQGGLAQNAVVMDWIGGGKEAAEQGHDVVMTPNVNCYLNYYQSTNHATEPRAQGGYIPLQRIYAFDPIPTNLPAVFQAHILGAQGNLWTEWIASLPHVEYMLFPRTCALAEILWSSKDSRNWDNFRERLKVDEMRLDKLNVNYRRETSAPILSGPDRVTTDYLDAAISRDYPGFTGLSVDSLGKKHFPLVMIKPPAEQLPAVQVIQNGAQWEYRRPGIDNSKPPRWLIKIEANEIQLESYWSAADPPEPLVLNVDNSVCHATLLGLMAANASIQLPAILHFPDQGSFRISAESQTVKSLDYSANEYQAKTIRMTFPGATRNEPVVKYRWDVVAIHPDILGIEADARFDGFRRNWLNIFQFSPHWLMLANHVTSDTCAFCYYEYADIADETPILANGFKALDMVRQTLDRIIGGANAYGMPGHGSFPEFAADTLPSLLIASEDYVHGSKDNQWLATNYFKLKEWADKMLATDHDGNGLVEYTLSGNSGSWPEKLRYRPANWWDTIGFGHEDAYANALAYRALRGMGQLAQRAGQLADQSRYEAAADKLKAAYFKTFYNPATGVLAGWRSADGQLHDYYFPWVNGIAIHYGLIPEGQANAIMDHLLAKMKEVGYTRFDLGLPGNLIPVAKKDYVDSRLRFGGGVKADNSDGFQIYENGGATACFAYFTLAALYDLGRIDEGDKILFPMLAAFDQGNFQGHGDNGMSKDWKTWDGSCHGYEGFLTDNYYVLLSVLDRARAIKRSHSN